MGIDQDMVIKLRSEMDSAIKEVKRLNKELVSLEKTSGKNTKSFKESEESYKRIGKSVSSLTKQLGALATAYLSFQGAKELISTTSDLEKGFIEISKTTGITGDSLKVLEDDIFNLSTSMAGVSVEELQGVAATAGQLGIQGSKDILEFTRVISMMGTATDLTAEQAAEAMAGLGKSLGVPIQEFERLGSTIDKVSDNSNASAANLVEYSQRIAGMGKTFGLTADEVIALGATLKDVGISAELGGTAISKVMLKMVRDTKGFADASGVEFGQFAQLIENKPVKALEVFLTSLSKLSKGAKIQVLDDLKLTSSGAIQTVLKLSDGVDSLTKNLNTAKTEWKTNTALMKSYTTASSGFDAQMDTFYNQVKDLAYKIGEDLLPGLKDAVKGTGDWIASLDKKKVSEFTQTVKTAGTTLKNLARDAKIAHDYTAPDEQFGEGAGIFTVLGDHLLALAHAYNEVSYDANDLNDVMKAQEQKFNGVTHAIDNMALTSGNLDALKQSIADIVAENDKLIKQYNATHSKKQQAAAAELTKKNEALKESLNKLNTDPAYKNLAKDIDKASDSTKKLSDATKKYTEAEVKELEKLNDKRVKDTEKTIDKLDKSEKKLADDIVKINQKLQQELKKISNDRFKTNQNIETKIAELKRGVLNEDAAYYDRQREAEKALSDAKLALKAGELEKYKYYIDQYQSLVTDSAGKEIKINDRVAVSADETRRRGIEGLKNIQQLENAYYTQKEQLAKDAHNQALAQKELELDAIKVQLEAQRALLLASKELTEALTGKSVDIDTSSIDAGIAKIEGLKQGLQYITSMPVSPAIDNTPIDTTKQKVEELKTLTLNGITLQVDANTNPADFGIKKLVTKNNGNEITMELNPEWEKAQKDLNVFRNAEEKEPIKTELIIDISDAEVNIDKIQQPTASKHIVDDNVPSVLSEINKLKITTHSEHIIHERIIPARAGGGLVPKMKAPQYLATGGRFTGSGRVPGYDPTDSDKVNAKLTGGEFVIKRRAVDAIDPKVLHDINNMRFNLPKLPRYAEGGLVGAGSTSTQVSPGQTPINLNIGGKTFTTMADKDIAEAVMRHIDSEGGL